MAEIDLFVTNTALRKLYAKGTRSGGKRKRTHFTLSTETHEMLEHYVPQWGNKGGGGVGSALTELGIRLILATLVQPSNAAAPLTETLINDLQRACSDDKVVMVNIAYTLMNISRAITAQANGVVK
jgi:hypothetical protein